MKPDLAYGLTRTLKNEISRIAPHTADYCGGRVNCVCPGWTVTPLTAKHLGNRTLARHLTGQTLVLAGGMEGRLLWDPGEIRAELA